MVFPTRNGRASLARKATFLNEEYNDTPYNPYGCVSRWNNWRWPISNCYVPFVYSYIYNVLVAHKILRTQPISISISTTPSRKIFLYLPYSDLLELLILHFHTRTSQNFSNSLAMLSYKQPLLALLSISLLASTTVATTFVRSILLSSMLIVHTDPE